MKTKVYDTLFIKYNLTTFKISIVNQSHLYKKMFFFFEYVKNNRSNIFKDV
jgi:hypothetical protein